MINYLIIIIFALMLIFLNIGLFNKEYIPGTSDLANNKDDIKGRVQRIVYYKKATKFWIFIAVVLSVIVCGVSLTNAITKAIRGSTNSINNGIAAKSGNWVFYHNNEDDYKLYKMLSDGSKNIKVNEDRCFHINTVEGWIYYQNRSLRRREIEEQGKIDYQQGDNCIYRIRQDGTQRTRISEDPASSVIISNGWIYYYNNDDSKIYKVGLDETQRSLVVDDVCGSFTVTEDSIYYESQNEGIFEVNINTLERKKICDDVSRGAAYSEGWIYYSNGNDAGKLYKIKADGSSKAKLSDDYAIYINTAADWIYYVNFDDDSSLYKIKSNGSSRVQISDHKECADINIIDEYIYYVTWQEGEYGQLFRVKNDGTLRKKISEVKK